MTERTTHTWLSRARASRLSPAAAALAVGLVSTGCEGIFDVENPNQLVQEDLEKPTAVAALVNGAEATVARGVADMLLAASIPTDELTWVGSYDAGRELDTGYLTNPANEFTDNEAWGTFSEARFMADEAIRLVRGFDEQDQLGNREMLARAYLYGGIMYTYIPDWYDDFVLSQRKDPAPPVGEGSMVGLYDTAIGYLTSGIEVARAVGKRETEATLLAQRARTHHAKAVWQKLNPAGQTPGNPLVASPEAAADARAALEIVGADWRYQFQYSASTVGNQLGGWINSRQEFRVDTIYGVPTASGTRVQAVALEDPIDGTVDPALSAALTEFGALSGSTELYPPLTVVSARELRLILAEHALASGNEDEAAQHINAVRELDGLTPYTGQIPIVEMLMHERRVNLFLQGRRLADMYRFGIEDPRWLDASEAKNRPGTFFPIPDKEIKANCHLAGGC